MNHPRDLPAQERPALQIALDRRAAVEGDLERGSFLCGQIAGMIHEVRPAAQIIREMSQQAEALLKGAAAWVK